MIRLQVPGLLRYRDVVLRVVAAGARLLAPEGAVDERTVDEVVSALGEAFNNLVLHGYGLPASEPGGRPTEDPSGQGLVTIELVREARTGGAFLVAKLSDTGRAFDPRGHDEPPESLPERGMGLHIIRAFIDEIDYVPGTPNVLTLRKAFARTPSDDALPDERRSSADAPGAAVSS
jgi:anti-sigma regulatory factor (Ser/Thr protein kinase)